MTPEKSKTSDYFRHLLPAQLAAALADAPANVLEQEALSVTYELIGDGACTFSLCVLRGEMEVVEGAIDDVDMRTIVDAGDFHATHATAWEEPLVKYVREEKVEGIKKLKGTLKLDLRRPDQSNYQSATIFGGREKPEATLKMHLGDYVELANGSLKGQVAVMVGKMKFSGSVPFLLQVAMNT